MRAMRFGKLTDSNPETGDVLAVQLHTDDIRALCNPNRRYCVNRIGDDGNGIAGWALEDKIHMRLEVPLIGNSPNEELLELSLDPGGDLYFTIWENERLKQVKEGAYFKREDVVKHDPSDLLRHLGINAIGSFGLGSLGFQLYRPRIKQY